MLFWALNHLNRWLHAPVIWFAISDLASLGSSSSKGLARGKRSAIYDILRNAVPDLGSPAA